MWRSFGPGIGARDVIGMVAAVVDEFQFRKWLSVKSAFGQERSIRASGTHCGHNQLNCGASRSRQLVVSS